MTHSPVYKFRALDRSVFPEDPRRTDDYGARVQNLDVGSGIPRLSLAVGAGREGGVAREGGRGGGGRDRSACVSAVAVAVRGRDACLATVATWHAACAPRGHLVKGVTRRCVPTTRRRAGVVQSRA